MSQLYCMLKSSVVSIPAIMAPPPAPGGVVCVGVWVWDVEWVCCWWDP